MNDRPPSGLTTPAGSGFSGYTGYEDPYGQAAAYGYAVTDADHGYTASGYGDDDPLFGTLPDDGGHSGAVGASQPHPTTGYDGFPTQQAPFADSSYDGSAYGGASYGDATYGTTEYGTGTYGAGLDVSSFPSSDQDNNAFSQAAGYETGGFSADPYGTAASYDPLTAEGWGAVENPLSAIPAQPDHGWADSTGSWDAGTYTTDAWDAGPATGTAEEGSAASTHDTGPGPEFTDHGDALHEDVPGHDLHADTAPADGPDEGPAQDHAAQDHAAQDFPAQDFAPHDLPAHELPDPDDEPHGTGPTEPSTITVPATRGGRRRAAKPKRSALLTVAVPSVAVMGVAGIAAASVGSDVAESAEDAPVQAAPDTDSVKSAAVNNKLDTQLAGLSAEVRDFGDRASRTQERIDLKARQEAERKRKAEEAARREALRPKFALPVDQRGLSAYYGQAGINWMSVHTGIDFPVGYGTPVKAATDGTVTTKWDLAYGNMMVVTAPDGTETWYCHLSSTRIRSGQVKAGDTIGYAGSSGNSTGPHLHFEVRPGGGSAVDPVAWFRGKGLDPT